MSKKFIFHRERSNSNPYRVFAIVAVILAGLFLLRSFGTGEVKEFLHPTPRPRARPTRSLLKARAIFKPAI
jgi:hypothetical protein